MSRYRCNSAEVQTCSSKSTDAIAERVIGDNENSPAEVAGRPGVEIWPSLRVSYMKKLINELKGDLGASLNASKLPGCYGNASPLSHGVSTTIAHVMNGLRVRKVPGNSICAPHSPIYFEEHLSLRS